MRSIRLLFLAPLLALVCSCNSQTERDSTGSAGQPEVTAMEAAPPRDNSTRHFWFDYRGEPDPGRRVWMRVQDDVWAELYPNGNISRYRRSGRVPINGEEGTTVQKFEGAPFETLTFNDGSFEVFIPDRTSTNRILGFRHRQNGEWGPWTGLARIIPIE